MTVDNAPYKIVVWGDSIAVNNGSPEGSWPVLTERLLGCVAYCGRTVEIINEGHCGMPACQAITEFETRVAKHNPDLVIIQFGFNDLRYQSSHAGRPLSTLDEFKVHLAGMVDKCRELGSDVILHGNHKARPQLRLPSGVMYDEARALYSAVAKDVAGEAGVTYYNMAYELTCEAYTWQELLSPDGVHLSALGNSAYAWFVTSYLQEMLQGNA
jgi:lysophospholipase L1-like esterase